MIRIKNNILPRIQLHIHLLVGPFQSGQKYSVKQYQIFHPIIVIFNGEVYFVIQSFYRFALSIYEFIDDCFRSPRFFFRHPQAISVDLTNF